MSSRCPRTTGEAKEKLLAEAGEAVGSLPGVGDVQVYLRAYYRHVADDDLVAAGPQRLAAVAREQAELAAMRPQGRAIVRVRRGRSGRGRTDLRRDRHRHR